LVLCHEVRSISAPSRVAYARWNTSWRNVSLPYSAVHQQCEVPQYLGADHECTVGCVSFIAVPSHRAKAAFMGYPVHYLAVVWPKFFPGLLIAGCNITRQCIATGCGS